MLNNQKLQEKKKKKIKINAYLSNVGIIGGGAPGGNGKPEMAGINRHFVNNDMVKSEHKKREILKS